jgi:hypothetical protein
MKPVYEGHGFLAGGVLIMALQDHFRPPLSVRRHWHAFHNAWATYISSDLNQRLPEGYFAEANVQFGIEIDVATFEEAGARYTDNAASGDHISYPSAEAGVGWTAPVPTQTVPIAIITDTVEVLVFNREAGPTLAGAIELVSPANKERPAHRDAFVSKCAAYLQQGIGLIIVDIVTGRRANLHDELLARLRAPEVVPWDAELYAVAYRPVKRAGQPSLDMWQATVAVGASLPTLPLWLRGNLCLPVDLDMTYHRTCHEQRIIVNGV